MQVTSEILNTVQTYSYLEFFWNVTDGIHYI